MQESIHHNAGRCKPSAKVFFYNGHKCPRVFFVIEKTCKPHIGKGIGISIFVMMFFAIVSRLAFACFSADLKIRETVIAALDFFHIVYHKLFEPVRSGFFDQP
jgi:hypothetical protein